VPWKLLCQEMKKLNIRLRGRNIVELLSAAAVNDIPVNRIWRSPWYSRIPTSERITETS